MMKHFTAYTDSQHGWLAVKRNLLVTLGITDQITSYSYQRGQTVYLEENQDVTTFANAMEARGIEWTHTIKHCDYSPIRYYDCYRP